MTEEQRREVSDFYFNHYRTHFRVWPQLADALASIPQARRPAPRAAYFLRGAHRRAPCILRCGQACGLRGGHATHQPRFSRAVPGGCTLTSPAPGGRCLKRDATQVNIYDDHDIFDGYGSYPPRLQLCPVFQGARACQAPARARHGPDAVSGLLGGVAHPLRPTTGRCRRRRVAVLAAILLPFPAAHHAGALRS